MKQILTTLFVLGLLWKTAAQTQPADVCTSKVSYSVDEEVTWYWNLAGNTIVTPIDPVYFYSWAPAGSQTSVQLSYERDMIWSLTWTPTDYYGVDLATLETAGNSAFWHSLTTTGNVSVTGTVDFSIKESLRLGTTCACMLPDPRQSYAYYFDFGPNDVSNGNETSNPDTNGNYWNNVSNSSSGAAYDVISNANDPTGIALTLNSTFGTNGINHGGLLAPNASFLGEYAINTASQDYFFTTSTTGIGFAITGLDQTKTYTFGFFGSRVSSERITSYTVTGANGSLTANLTTGSTDIGSDGIYDGNDQTIVEVGPITPTSDCELTVDIAVVSGGFAYLNFMYVIETNQQLTWSAASWSNGSGPDLSTDVTIDDDFTTATSGSLELANLTVNAGKTLTVSTGTSLNIHGDVQNDGSIVVASGGSLMTYDGNTVDGNDIMIKRNTRFADGKYSFVGSPVVQDASITGTDLGTWVYSYDESTAYELERWKDATTSELMAGKGYAQAGQQEITFSGTPNSGMITYTGTYTDRTDANDGWNLVANPYAAAINFTEFMTDNSNNTGSVYLWDDNGSDMGRGDNGDYIVINASGNTNSTADNLSRYNGHIGSSQAFFIKLNGMGDNNVVFNEDQRVGGNNSDDNFFRKANEIQRLRINLTNEKGLFKQTLIAWNDEVDDTKINRLYDASMFDKNAQNAVYTAKLDQALAIQTVTSAVTRIPLGVHIGSEGTYRLVFDANEFQGELYLLDHVSGNTVVINDGAYEFSAKAGSLSNRFELVSMNSILNVDLKSDWKIYAGGQTIHIQPISGTPSEFKIFSISGRFITSLDVSKSVQLQMNEKPGVYIVTNGIYSQKVILK
jgi:hypothetical protein